jgi:hypothetical protein
MSELLLKPSTPTQVEEYVEVVFGLGALTAGTVQVADAEVYPLPVWA